MTTTQSNTPDPPSPGPNEPIFQTDIPCPHCEYNLRGLTELRCPECGELFDMKQVWEDHQRLSRPLPPLKWTIANVLRRRESFWQLPQVSYGQGPKLWMNGVVVLLASGGIWLLILVASAAIGKPMDLEKLCLAFVGTAFCAIVLSFLHMTFCWCGLWVAGSRDAPRDTDVVVGYSLPWLIVFAPLMIGLRMAKEIPISIAASGLDLLLGLALIAVCIMWGVTLYEGGRTVSHGSRGAGLWCAISNPFWYVSLLIIAQ